MHSDAQIRTTEDGTNSSNRILRVAVISEVVVTREALALFLAGEGNISITSVASSLREIQGKHEEGPDVALIDGLTVSTEDEQAPARRMRLAIFGLMPRDRTSILKWVAAGAAVFVPSRATKPELLIALNAAARDDVACPTEFADIVIRDARKLREWNSEPGHAKLSPREREVLGLIG